MTKQNRYSSLSADNVLQLPYSMWVVYASILAEYGKLQACAGGTSKNEIYGGPSFEQTIDHFTYRFGNSISRICYLIVDPDHQIRDVSSDLLATFAGDSIRVLDLAGGTGAGMVGLLSTLVQLRMNGDLPRLPLNVEIIGADISSDALQIYKKFLEKSKPFYREAGILVDIITQTWDASDSSQTADLCDTFLEACGDMELFVLVSNLSGVKSHQWTQMTRSFQHVTERIARKTSTLLWIEPQGGGATEFLSKVRKGVFDFASWLKLVSVEKAEFKYKWHHRIQIAKKEIDRGVQVMRYIRSEV